MVQFLRCVQFVVLALQFHEFVMCSWFWYFAMFDDDNLFSIVNGGQPVSDSDACAAFLGFIQCFLYNLEWKRTNKTTELLRSFNLTWYKRCHYQLAFFIKKCNLEEQTLKGAWQKNQKKQKNKTKQKWQQHWPSSFFFMKEHTHFFFLALPNNQQTHKPATSRLTFSLSVSKAEVASSNNRILGLRTKALAMATLCFCPPDSCVPLSPTLVSYPCQVDCKMCNY